MNPYVSQCAALRECLASTDFARIPGLNTPEGPPTVVYDHLLNTYFWCRSVSFVGREGRGSGRGDEGIRKGREKWVGSQMSGIPEKAPLEHLLLVQT